MPAGGDAIALPEAAGQVEGAAEAQRSRHLLDRLPFGQQPGGAFQPAGHHILMGRLPVIQRPFPEEAAPAQAGFPDQRIQAAFSQLGGNVPEGVAFRLVLAFRGEAAEQHLRDQR